MKFVQIPLDQLSSERENFHIREFACLDLQQLSDWGHEMQHAVVEELLKHAADPQEDFRVRIASIRALGSRPEVIEAAIPELTRMLNDDDYELRREAWDVLSEWGIDQASFRREFQTALAHWDPSAISGFLTLAEYWSDRAAGLTDALVLALGHGDPGVRKCCLEALLEIGPAGWDAGVESALADAAGRSADARERMEAVQVLFQLGVDIERLYPHLVARSQDFAVAESEQTPQEPQEFGWARARVDRLAGKKKAKKKTKETEEAGLLGYLESFSGDYRPEFRLEGARLLADFIPLCRTRHNRASALGRLEELACDRESEVRAEALRRLGLLEELGQPAIETVRAACGDGDPSVRVEAHKALTVLCSVCGKG